MSGFGQKKMVREMQEKRRSKRSKARALATVHTPASTEPVTVVDVSESGARLIGSPPRPSRRDVQLRVNGLTMFGTVAWRKEDSFGLEFDQSLNEYGSNEIHRAVREAGAASPEFDREAVLQELQNQAFNKEESEEVTGKANGSELSD